MSCSLDCLRALAVDSLPIIISIFDGPKKFLKDIIVTIKLCLYPTVANLKKKNHYKNKKTDKTERQNVILQGLIKNGKYS